jgi:hypothetical protein
MEEGLDEIRESGPEQVNRFLQTKYTDEKGYALDPYLGFQVSVASDDTIMALPDGSERARALNQVGTGVEQVLPILPYLAGKTEEERELAEQEAKKKEPVKELAADDPGPMPEYGTKEFWAWCWRRKAIRLAKEAAIIAAGGTVPPAKVKKPKAKEPKAKEPKQKPAKAPK